MLMTQQYEAESQRSLVEREIDSNFSQKQQLIVCTNSGIKVYDIYIDQINSLEDSAHFLKYKLSALPNEKIVDLV